MAAPEELKLPCADGVALPATLFAAERPRATLVVAPAMGVPRKYYRAFASDMAARGIATLTFDYRGIGEAAASVKDPQATRFTDWGEHDLHAALALVDTRFPGVPAFVIGHSAGAQIPGLTPLSEKLAGLIFVAGSRPHLSVDRGARALFSALWWYAIVPLGSLGAWFPAKKLGFANVDIPAGVTRQWGIWARTPRYLFDPRHGIDTSRYPRLAQPLLAYSFSDDVYCPVPSAEGLLAEYPNAKVTRRHVKPADVGARAIGHVGFFRDAMRDSLWKETADWMLSVIPA